MNLGTILDEIDQETKKDIYSTNEDRLRELILELFNHSTDTISLSIQSYVEKILSNVISTEKTGWLSYPLYEGLEQSEFPFSQELLRRAIDIEDYNSSDIALKCYISACLKSTNIPNNIHRKLLENIPEGHLFSYIDILRTIGDSKPKTQFKIPQDLKNTLIHILSNVYTDQLKNKALCCLIYFEITDIIPILNSELQKCTQQIDEIEKKVNDLGILSKITSVATSLEYLTEDTRYRELVDFIKPEMCFGRREPYSPEFIKILIEKMKQFKL